MSNHSEPREPHIVGAPAQAPDHQLVETGTTEAPIGTDQQPPQEMKRPEDHGSWDGDEFVFHKPVEMGGNIIKRLQTKGMVLEPGVTRDDVVHALLNQVAAPRRESDDGTWPV